MIHKFKKGDIIELINDKTMSAQIGAKAVVTGYDQLYVAVIWLKETYFLNGKQMNGGYYKDIFKLVKPITQTENLKRMGII